VFHTIPHPGEYGYDTWPKDAWTYSGGAGNWGEMSIDEKRGIAYVPTGTPKYEFWGGDRHGDTLFADCVLALDARTGKRLWHYQTIHHDVWEYELVAAPQLLTVRVNGQPRDIVAQASKNGFLYVLDRVTGKPIWPIDERPVPKTDVPGEQLSPTQPFPSKPPAFERQSYTVEDIDSTILTPAERARWRDMVLKARNQGIYTPFGTDNFSVMMPGNSGGAGLFSTSSDQAAGTVYVISFSQPALMRLYTTAAEASRNIGHTLYGPPVLNGKPGPDGLQITRTRGGGPGAAGGGVDPVAAQGRAMYEQTCQQCHGVTLGAENGGAPSLIGILDRMSEADVRTTIRDGRGPMPTFATMGESDLTGLVAFLRNPASAPAAGGRGGARGAPPPYPPGVDVPQRLFTTYGMSPAHVKPPYSSITAYDLNTGTIKWQIPYGEAIGVDPPGNNFGMIKIHGPKARLGITAGGLAFSATIEKRVRAFDKDTGKVLWMTTIPDAAEGAPAIYDVDGREFVVFCVRGSYIAYALPAKG
jgi:quinoprotein glucose dehydrogenase